MSAQTFDGHYGRTVALDLCHPCGALWFDGEESLGLAPGAVLRIFALISDHRGELRAMPAPAPTCPRCRRGLARTRDKQRDTAFVYWRCPAEHGRFTAFAEFLREKRFVRPLSLPELTALRANVKTIQCSSCGAPVDLVQSSACGHCRAPVSTLDARQVERVVAELRQAEEKRRTVDPTLPARLMMDRLEVERLFYRLDHPGDGSETGGARGLVEAGLDALAEIFSSRAG
jgi:hypothetical protein